MADLQQHIQLETGYSFKLYNLEKTNLKSKTPNFTLSLFNYKNINQIFANQIPIGVAVLNLMMIFDVQAKQKRVYLKAAKQL